MINFEKKVLENGLTVLTHQDSTTPMSAVNIIYKVGSRDEHEARTGFAHLFEHLMFGGSANVPDFDEVIQVAGGENNAFTNSDYTNFYEIVPADNIESALWVEADRMANLVLSEDKLNIQRKVVIEEFKEVCLNTPYGETWHHLSALAYKKHPYKWPTIGKIPRHITDATIGDVKSFFTKYYHPRNAILSIASPLSHNKMHELAKRWFSEIEDGPPVLRSIPIESEQKEKRSISIKSDVPLPAIYLAFPMPARKDREYYACDLLSDILANGKSSRFHQNLVKKHSYFSHIDSYISGTFDPGLIIVDGKPMPEVDIDLGIEKIWEQFEAIKKGHVDDRELIKIRNKLTTEIILSNLDILNKAMILAYFEVLGDANLANKQIDEYSSIEKAEIIHAANNFLLEEKMNELIYVPN